MPVTGLLIPLAGTCLGSAAVFLMKNSINPKLEKILCGFAAGVMIAASVWSLIIPSVEMSASYKLKFIPAVSGFLIGIILFIAFDVFAVPAINNRGKALNKTYMTALAVTLHNIPEGMAVGVAVAAAMNEKTGVSQAAAAALCIGIAIQNFPEGAIVSMPLKGEGLSKNKAFLFGSLSGAVEPIFGLLTLLVTKAVLAALPYLLSFAAGAMIYVVSTELIPEACKGKYSAAATAGLAAGFSVMMALDVEFG